MKKFIFALCFFAARAEAIPVYSENFASYPNAQVITFTSGANYVASYAASGSAVTDTKFSSSAKITGTGNWMHAIYNGAQYSLPLSITVRCDGSAARCNFVYCVTGVAGGLPTGGYQLQSIPGSSQFRLFKNGYGTQILDAGAIVPANTADYTIGVYVSSTGTATIFMDGVAKGAVNDTFASTGYFGIATFGGTAYVGNIVVDNTLAAAASGAKATMSPRLRPALGSRSN